MEHSERAQRAGDGVAAFHAYHRCDLVLLERLLHLVGSQGELKAVRITAQELMNDVDLLHGVANGFPALQAGRHEDGPELATETSFTQTRDIGVKLWLRPAKVETRERASHLGAILRRDVVVTVDEGYFRVKRPRPFLGRWPLGGCAGPRFGGTSRKSEAADDENRNEPVLAEHLTRNPHGD